MSFYNNTVDLLDLMLEYYTWQNPSTYPGYAVHFFSVSDLIAVEPVYFRWLWFLTKYCWLIGLVDWLVGWLIDWPVLWSSVSGHCRFSFCQYPFILSISAKRTILQRDSEQQMIIMARVSNCMEWLWYDTKALCVLYPRYFSPSNY